MSRLLRVLVPLISILLVTAVQAQEAEIRSSGNPFPAAASVMQPVHGPTLASRKTVSALGLASRIGAESATMQWIEGAYQNTYHFNCITAQYEALTGEWVGYWGNTDATSPKVGEIYYVHVNMGTVGNACAGVYGNLEAVLPPNTYLYITQQYPVYCYQTNSQGQTTRNTANCPQSLSTGTYGYRLNPTNYQPGAWPLPIGASIEVQVPVFSTTTMSGIATNSYFQGAVQAIDGASNPWDNPKIGVFVAPNPPTVTYPTPSATSITNTTARTTAYVNNHFTAGNVYFDLGTTNAYGTTQGPGAVPDTWDSGTFYVDWSALTPGTTYHWRMRFLPTGGGTYYGADQTFTTTGSAPVSVVKGDFTADGKTDIVLRNYATGANAVWVMNGTALSSTVDLPALPNLNFRIEGTNDFNADNKNDIVLRNYSTGANALWVMNGTSLSTIVDLPALPNLNFKFEGTGDFNADGKPDIVLRNYSTGQNAVWIMNGTSLSSVVDLPTLPNLNYRIDGVGDMNADNKPDIILRNYSTGQNAVWIMNGTTLSSTQDLPTLPNLNYEINGPR